MTRASAAREWRMRLQLLRADLHRDIELVRGLTAVRRREGILAELLADLDHQLDRSEAAAVITLVGATGAGKSTVLNALARQEIAREGVDRPTTSEPTIYAPRDADVSSLVGASDLRVVRYTPAPGEADAHVYVDAPDMNSVASLHADRVRGLAQRSDVLLVVLHRQSVVEAAPVEFLDAFAQRRALGFLLNRADELTDESREALLGQIRELARTRWGVDDAAVVALSARRAREDPDGEDRRRLQQTIAALLGGQAIDRIRRHNALGTAAMVANSFAEVQAEVGEDLGALRNDVASGMERLAHEVADTSDESWRLHSADMNELLWAETARRWEGPGGWALRLGKADLLGVGAAGALARSHPLLAIGTAVTAAAASGVRQVFQERRLHGSSPLMPTAEELNELYRGALAPARIRVGRLCGETDGLGLPSAEDTYEAVAASVGSAWSVLVDRDLPRAADRSALRFFRWLIDLPVYGLVAWLVYRAVLGFAEGNYVGVDLLLNSGLLAVVYLLCVRLGVRLGMRRRARRLLETAAAASRAGLARWHERVDEDLATRVDTVASALARLARLDADWLDRAAG